MNRTTITAMIMAACIGTSSMAMAAPGQQDPQQPRYEEQQPQQKHDQQGHEQKGQQGGHEQQGHGQPQARNSQGHGPSSWKQGEKMPSKYRDDRHAVSDWHAHGLSKPPAGHRWFEVDGRYVLAAVASGVITSIILGH